MGALFDGEAIPRFNIIFPNYGVVKIHDMVSLSGLLIGKATVFN